MQTLSDPILHRWKTVKYFGHTDFFSRCLTKRKQTINFFQKEHQAAEELKKLTQNSKAQQTI